MIDFKSTKLTNNSSIISKLKSPLFINNNRNKNNIKNNNRISLNTDHQVPSGTSDDLQLNIIQPTNKFILKSKTLNLTTERTWTRAEASEFDCNMKYGPSAGISRRDRWARANKFGLNPPSFE